MDGLVTRLKKSLLLVEDDPNDVALFRRAARKADLSEEILIAEDGEAAVRFLEGCAEKTGEQGDALPGIVLLDLKMPRKSGLEVLQWLRRQPRLRRLPVIVFTSSRERSDITRAYELGANSYLVKPVSFDQLKEMVQALDHYWLDLNESPQGY
jgi:CheY-like chemotaxis protein